MQIRQNLVELADTADKTHFPSARRERGMEA